jgi:hypothetical protein
MFARYMNLAFVIIFCLAVFRVTRLVTKDVFPPVKWVRDKALQSKLPEPVKYLVECTWCASVWIALVGVIIFPVGWSIRDRLLLLLAASAVSGLVESELD